MHWIHGQNLMQCNRYRFSVHEKRQIATDLCEGFVQAVTDIWNSEDPEVLIEAHVEGKKPVSASSRALGTRSLSALTRIQHSM